MRTQDASSYANGSGTSGCFAKLQETARFSIADGVEAPTHDLVAVHGRTAAPTTGRSATSCRAVWQQPERLAGALAAQAAAA